MNNHTKSILYRIAKRGGSGVEAVNIENDLVVFPLCGSVAIFYNGIKTVVGASELLLLNRGIHQVEFDDCQLIVFQLPVVELEQVILYLSADYQLCIDTDHSCDACRFRNFFVTKPSAALTEFFSSINRLLDIECLDENNRRLKLPELIYLILSSGSDCLKYRLLRMLSYRDSRFLQAVYNQIFAPASLSEMAHDCSVSESTFKREFSRRFHTSLHRWSATQRLDRAQILLRTTTHTVSEIATLCAYTNLSHFCKSFKQHYNITPTKYRKLYKIKE
jgi:AraC-like DNA-binding protein